MSDGGRIPPGETAGAGLRVLCVTNMWPGEADPDFGAFVQSMCGALEREGCTVEVAAIDRRGGGPLRGVAKYARLAAATVRRARDADVIYAHFLFPTGAIATLAGRLAGRPVVVTAHGQDVANLSRRALRRATAPVLRRARTVVAVSGYLAERIADAGPAPDRVEIVNMGVDMERFAPAGRAAARSRLGIAPDGPLVLAVGGLTARKNPLTLLQAFARLRAGSPGARLAFVGDGPLASTVDAGVRHLLLDDAVIRTGALPHEAVGDWVAACDVLAMVSRVEPLGVVALEALAGGRPVVVTEVGGAREVVPDPEAGRVVDPGDPTAIARALAELIADPPGPEACRAAAAPHALSVQAAKITAILRSAAEGPAEPASDPTAQAAGEHP
jgi:glycosyltransferase involved in cell wall biosynthesis